jgi:hypothetical protein
MKQLVSLVPVICLFVSQISFAESKITEDDLTSGYLVAHSSSGNSHVVEIVLLEALSGSGLLVTSYREAVADSKPSQKCMGNADLDDEIATFDVVCGQDEYVFYVNFSGVSSADLINGAPVLVQSGAIGNQWLPYTLKIQSEPYFK